MIQVQPSPEPADFAVKVRAPGQAFLRTTRQPTRQGYQNHQYWRACLGQLHNAYGQVCAYSSIWIPTGYTVDHFRPKGKYPNLAYEWSNYRLALNLVNNNKRDSDVVLDPFVVHNGWFILDSASLWVKPEPTLDAVTKARVQTSINVLQLNHNQLLNVRFQILRGYIDGAQKLDSLEQKYPFIAAEIKRQGIKTKAQILAEKTS
ncbi:MAG: hypothetical protein WA405_04875 [Candidatus Acidiferrales bacterium]